MSPKQTSYFIQKGKMIPFDYSGAIVLKDKKSLKFYFGEDSRMSPELKDELNISEKQINLISYNHTPIFILKASTYNQTRQRD